MIIPCSALGSHIKFHTFLSGASLKYPLHHREIKGRPLNSVGEAPAHAQALELVALVNRTPPLMTDFFVV